MMPLKKEIWTDKGGALKEVRLTNEDSQPHGYFRSEIRTNKEEKIWISSL